MIDAIRRAVREMVKPLATQVANLVSRAVVSRVNDGAKLQEVQVGLLADETRDNIERFQQYGFTSVPLEGAEAVVLFVGGRRDHGLAVAVDDRRYRLKDLEPGEVALYHKDGASVVLRADGSVEVTPKPGAVVKLAGDGDALALASKVESRLAHLEAALNTHVHASFGTPATPVPLVFPVEDPAGSGVVGAVASGKVKAE
jgi:phage baseplate assembly protein V